MRVDVALFDAGAGDRLFARGVVDVVFDEQHVLEAVVEEMGLVLEPAHDREQAAIGVQWVARRRVGLNSFVTRPRRVARRRRDAHVVTGPQLPARAEASEPTLRPAELIGRVRLDLAANPALAHPLAAPIVDPLAGVDEMDGALRIGADQLYTDVLAWLDLVAPDGAIVGGD